MKEDPIEKDGFVRTHRDDTRYAQFAQDIFDLDLLLRETHARRYKESRQGPRSQFEERLAERIQRDRILTEDSVRHAIRLVDDYTKELEGTKKGNSIDNILRKITVHTRIVGNNDISSADVALRKLPHMAYQLSDVDLTRWTLIGSHNSAEDKISYFSLDEWAKTVCIGLNTAKVGMENYEKSPHQRFAVKTEAEIRNNLAGIISLQGIRGVSEELMDSITGRPFHDDEKVTALQVYAHMLKIIGAENRNLPKTAYLGTAEVVAWTADTNPMDALIWSYIGLRLSNSEREEYFKLEGKGKKVFDGLLDATRFELPSQLPTRVYVNVEPASVISDSAELIEPVDFSDEKPNVIVNISPPKATTPFDNSTFFDTWDGDEPEPLGYNLPEQPPPIPYAEPTVRIPKNKAFLLTQDLPEIGADAVLAMEEFFEAGEGMVVEIVRPQTPELRKPRRRITLRDTITSLTLPHVEGAIPMDNIQREVTYMISINNSATNLNNGNNPLAEESVIESMRLLGQYGFDDIMGIDIVAGSLEGFHSHFTLINAPNYESKMSAALEGTSWIINYGAAFGHSEGDIRTAVVRWSDYISVAPQEFDERYLAGTSWESMSFISNVYRSMRKGKIQNQEEPSQIPTEKYSIPWKKIGLAASALALAGAVTLFGGSIADRVDQEAQDYFAKPTPQVELTTQQKAYNLLQERPDAAFDIFRAALVNPTTFSGVSAEDIAGKMYGQVIRIEDDKTRNNFVQVVSEVPGIKDISNSDLPTGTVYEVIISPR